MKVNDCYLVFGLGFFLGCLVLGGSYLGKYKSIQKSHGKQLIIITSLSIIEIVSLFDIRYSHIGKVLSVVILSLISLK